MKKAKIKTQVLVLTYVLIALSCVGQKEGNTWYFGTGNGLNFNQSCDILDLTSSMNGLEGCVSLSDANGDLIFYTNGGRSLSSQIEGKIWNKNHTILHDMSTTEGGGASSRQSSIAVPKVGSTNNYYLFTMDESEAVFLGGDRGFSYYEIDMNANGGLGAIVDYQESVNIGSLPGVFSPESISAVRKPDGVL